MICIFSWFTAKNFPSQNHCFTIPKRNSWHNLRADHKCCQGAQLASLLHTDIGRDRVRVVRRRPTIDEQTPWNGKSCKFKSNDAGTSRHHSFSGQSIKSWTSNIPYDNYIEKQITNQSPESLIWEDLIKKKISSMNSLQIVDLYTTFWDPSDCTVRHGPLRKGSDLCFALLQACGDLLGYGRGF